MKKFVFISLCLFVGFASFSSVSNNSRAIYGEEIKIPGDVAHNNEGCGEEMDREGCTITESQWEKIMDQF